MPISLTPFGVSLVVSRPRLPNQCLLSRRASSLLPQVDLAREPSVLLIADTGAPALTSNAWRPPVARRAVCHACSANSRWYLAQELKTHPWVPGEEEGAAEWLSPWGLSAPCQIKTPRPPTEQRKAQPGGASSPGPHLHLSLRGEARGGLGRGGSDSHYNPPLSFTRPCPPPRPWSSVKGNLLKRELWRMGSKLTRMDATAPSRMKCRWESKCVHVYASAVRELTRPACCRSHFHTNSVGGCIMHVHDRVRTCMRARTHTRARTYTRCVKHF